MTIFFTFLTTSLLAHLLSPHELSQQSDCSPALAVLANWQRQARICVGLSEEEQIVRTVGQCSERADDWQDGCAAAGRAERRSIECALGDVRLCLYPAVHGRTIGRKTMPFLSEILSMRPISVAKEVAEWEEREEWLVWANADVLVDMAMLRRVVQVASTAWHQEQANAATNVTVAAPVIVTRRHNVRVHAADLLAGLSDEQIRERAAASAAAETDATWRNNRWALDLLVAPRAVVHGLTASLSLPPYLVGAPAFDNALLHSLALSPEHRVIDASAVLALVHISHRRRWSRAATSAADDEELAVESPWTLPPTAAPLPPTLVQPMLRATSPADHNSILHRHFFPRGTPFGAIDKTEMIVDECAAGGAAEADGDDAGGWAREVARGGPYRLANRHLESVDLCLFDR